MSSPGLRMGLHCELAAAEQALVTLTEPRCSSSRLYYTSVHRVGQARAIAHVRSEDHVGDLTFFPLYRFKIYLKLPVLALAGTSCLTF